MLLLEGGVVLMVEEEEVVVVVELLLWFSKPFCWLRNGVGEDLFICEEVILFLVILASEETLFSASS